MNAINILIADDHQMFIDGLAALLGDFPDISILGTANDGRDAVRLVADHPNAHILIVDLNMPEMDGIQATKYLRRSAPAIRILALTQNADGGSVTKALKAGVDGYLIKTAAKNEFVKAIRAIASGGTYFSEEAKDSLVLFTNGRSQPVVDSTVEGLSEREKEILKLISLEYTTNEIAERLHISTYTVETHRRNMINKLNVRSTAGLVKLALRSGLLNGEE